METKTPMTREEQLYFVRNYAEKNMPSKPYHNFAHAEDVANVAAKLAKQEGCSQDEIHIVITVGYLHDLPHKNNYNRNEEDAAELMAAVLPTLDYTPAEVKTAQGMALATKVPTKPQNLLEQIICDADVDNLGRDDFFEKACALQKECGQTDPVKWWTSVYGFIQDHKYYTASARQLRQEGFEKNKARLKEMLLNFPR